MNKIRKSHIVATVIAAITIGIASGSALAGGFLDVEFLSGNFGSSTNINNPHWPLAPGAAATTFIYLGETEDGCVFDKVESNPKLSKVFTEAPYNTVTPMVVVDREWEVDEECDVLLGLLRGNRLYEPADKDLGELTDDWYAQDDFGNIWYMGELSQSFDPDEGCPQYPAPGVTPGTHPECFEGSWESGKYGPDNEIKAAPGIVVPSDTPFDIGPVGEPLTPGNYYLQEVAEGAEDMAKVLRMNARLDDFEGCRKVKEWNPLEHGESVEHKWYCPDGGGLVLIEGVGGGPTEIEELVLVFTP